MEPVEIIVLVAAVGLVAFTIIFNIIRKRKGKGCCGCDSCPSAKHCGKK